MRKADIVKTKGVENIKSKQMLNSNMLRYIEENKQYHVSYKKFIDHEKYGQIHEKLAKI